jgi:hypothetical protein
MNKPLRISLFLTCVFSLLGGFLFLRQGTPPSLDAAGMVQSGERSPNQTDFSQRVDINVAPSMRNAAEKAQATNLPPPVALAKPINFPAPVLPKGLVVNYIFDLIAKAESKTAPDAQAALMAFLAISSCGTFPYPPSGFQPSVANMKTVSKDCDGLPPELELRANSLLKRSAEMGNIHAQVAYANTRYAIYHLDQAGLVAQAEEVVEFKRDAMRFLASAASSGSLAALQSLSYGYEDGFITAKDPLLAYAYQYAFVESAGNPNFYKELTRLATPLTAAQISQAQAVGRQILSSCCSSAK